MVRHHTIIKATPGIITLLKPLHPSFAVYLSACAHLAERGAPQGAGEAQHAYAMRVQAILGGEGGQ
jgi:hypothetical protein